MTQEEFNVLKEKVMSMVQQRRSEVDAGIEEGRANYYSSEDNLIQEELQKIIEELRDIAKLAMPQFYGQYSPWKYVRTYQLMALVPEITLNGESIHVEYENLDVGFHPDISSGALIQMTAAGFRAKGRGNSIPWTFSAPYFGYSGSMEGFFNDGTLNALADQYMDKDPAFQAEFRMLGHFAWQKVLDTIVRWENKIVDTIISYSR